MEYLPALSILFAFLVLAFAFIFKFKTDDLLKVLNSSNFFLIGTLMVIFLLLIFHLFKNEAWTADLLKIAIGVFVGAGAIRAKEKKEEVGGINESIISNNSGKIAGRDINETIHNIEKAFGDIKDSVINQDNKINQFLGSTDGSDYIIHMIYTRRDILETIKQIINKWVGEGWSLKTVEFAFEHIDGVIIIFSRNTDQTPVVKVFRDGNFQEIG